MDNPTFTFRRLATFWLAALFALGLGSSRASAATDIGVAVGSKAVIGPSGQLSYVLTVFNTGTTPATNVTVSAAFPAHLSNGSLSAGTFTSCPTFNFSGFSCTLTSLAAGAQAGPLLSLGLTADAPNGFMFNLTFTVSSPDDTTPQNNSVTVITKVVSAPTTAGVFRNGSWYLNNQNDGSVPEFAFSYGIGSDVPVVGDWNCSGNQTVGVFRNGAWYLNNQNDGSAPEASFYFGQAGDVPVVGDWDGDGCTGIGVFRNGLWILSNQTSSPTVWTSFYYGAPSGDIPVTGDWDGNGTVTPGIFRGGQWFLTNQIGANPVVSNYFYFGQAGDTPLTGDWDANGTTNVGVGRGGAFFMNNQYDSSLPEFAFVYGAIDDRPIVGVWGAPGAP